MSRWIKIAAVAAFPLDAGAAALVDGVQIAIFNFGKSEWYAVQNECPHEHHMCISRGLVGDSNGRPKVACPMHKNNFFLSDGQHAGGNSDWTLHTWAVKEEDGFIYIEQKDPVLA